MPSTASPCRISAHGKNFRMYREGAAVTLDAEGTRNTQTIVHHLLSLHRLSEAFFASLPQDMQLREEAWEAIEHAMLALQHGVNVTVAQLLNAFNALRGEWSGRQWEGVVLGLLLASRPDLLSAHPLVENAWVRMQAQQFLKYPPERREETEES
jgi:hypothetical protein